MATMEKLILQIFERKKCIIDHVKSQADLFDQHLASKLLIDGISPPSWLWNPTFPSQSSYHPEELNKEELISGLFLPHPQLAVPYSSSYCSLYNKPVVTANNEAFSDGLFTNAHASNVGFDAGDGPSVLPQSSINNVGCASNVNGVPDQDPGVMSPEDRKDAKISDTYPDPVQSLARIQRSKSRQRALELRNSAREAKIRLCDEENTGVDASRFTGSVIASLQDDQSDRLKLVMPFDANNENCVVEETTVDDFRSKEKGNGIYSGRITRSRSSGRQPSCINESSTVGSPYIAKEDDGTRPVSLGRSKNQPNHRHELMELVNSPDTCNESCEMREAQTGDYYCKEIGSNIYSGRITRTGSGQQSNNVGESSAVVSFQIPKEDCGALAESLGKSTQQPNHANELLELVNSSDIGNESCELKEAKIGDYRSREKGSSKYCGRITRSRSYCQKHNCVNESSKLDSSSGNGKEDGVSKSIQQLNHFDDLVELVKASDTTSEGSGMKAKVGDYQSKEQKSNIYSGRITRSRSSCQQPNFTNESLKMGSSSNILKDDDGPLAESICKLMQPTQTLSWKGGEHNLPNAQHPLMAAVRSSPGKNDLKLRAANAVECSSCEISSAGYIARNTRSQGNQSVEETSKAVNSSNHPQRVTRSTSAASKMYENAQANRWSVRSSPSQNDLVFCTVKGLEHSDMEIIADEDVGKKTGSESICNIEEILNPNQSFNPLGCRGKRSRSNASKKFSLSSRCEDFDLQKMSGTDVSVGAPVCSGSNLEDASLRVGFEVLASRQPFDYPMFVKPKQLDFADVEDYSLNEITSPSAGEAQSKSLKENAVGEIWGRSSEPTDLPNGVVSINYEKECNSSLEMQLLEKQEDLTKEKDAYKGSYVDGIAEASRGSNFNPVSPVEETSEICKDSVPHTLLENDKISKQKISMIDSSTTLQEVSGNSLRSPLQEEFGSNLSNVNDDDDARMNPSVEGIGELDVAICTKADSKLDTDAYGGPKILVDADFTKEFLSAVTEDETRCHSVQQKIINAESSSSLGLCISDFKSVDCSKSSEHQISKKSIQPGRNFSPGIEGSWPWHKRRKIECQLTKSQSASPSLRVNPPDKEFAQSNIGNCPDVEMLQNVEHYTIEKFTFSPKLQIEEGDVSLRRERWVDTSYTFTRNQLDASLVSSLTRQATGYPQGQVTEEVEVAVPTSFILDVGRQCTAEENQDSLDPKDEFELEDKLERKSQIGGTGKFSYFPVFSPGSRSTDLVGPDHSMPVLEGFTMQADKEQPCISGIGISFDKLDLQNTTIDRASILEQLCKSACVHSPLTHISTTYKLHRTPNLYQSVPNGLLECMDLRSTLPIGDGTGKQLKASNSELNREVNCSLNRSYSDCFPLHSAQSVWDIRNPYMSPVGKLWDRISSNSGSSEKKGSLNSELPCISEESENTDEIGDTFQEGIGPELLTSSAKREPLVDIAENPNPAASVSEAEKYFVRDSLDSIKEEISFTGTRNRVKQKFVNHNSIKRRYNNKENENQSLSLGTNGSKRASESLHDRYSKPKLSGKTSLRKGGTDLSVKESKHNNIVSNVNSFIPLIQQKQAAAVVAGKRDIKVKALEAAGAAKRLEEERENERKRKKEALKVERARLEQENLRQLEIQKKRKEQERRKRDVEMASKKRQREEEERKGKEQKRKRIEETRRQQQDKEKLHADKEAERARERKETRDGTGKHEKMEKGRRDVNLGKVPETAPRAASVLTSDARNESTLLEDRKDSNVWGDITKVINNSDKATPINLVSNAIKEQSYEISPYQASEDEDEYEDDGNIQNSKFVPSWASKKCVALVVSSQQRLDPDTIFPPGSFCAIDEVCLPQKLGQKQLG